MKISKIYKDIRSYTGLNLCTGHNLKTQLVSRNVLKLVQQLCDSEVGMSMNKKL